MTTSLRNLARIGSSFGVMMLLGCAGSSTTTFDEETGDTSVGTTVHFDGGEAKLDKARSMAMAGEYDKAIDALELLWKDRSADEEYREAALFEIAQIHSAVLNPKRNPQSARYYFERFIAEFPESERRPLAEERILDLQAEIDPTGS